MVYFAIGLMIYGALCLLIVLLRPPFIYNMAKFKIMEKMMGKNGLNIFVAVWGLTALVVGYILY